MLYVSVFVNADENVHVLGVVTLQRGREEKETDDRRRDRERSELLVERSLLCSAFR